MVDAHWVSCVSWCGCEREVNLKWELAVQSGKGALRQSKDGWTASTVHQHQGKSRGTAVMAEVGQTAS